MTYSTKLISLYLFGLSSSKPSFINQIRQFLLHELLDLQDRLFKATFSRTRNMKVERRILGCIQQEILGNKHDFYSQLQ